MSEYRGKMTENTESNTSEDTEISAESEKNFPADPTGGNKNKHAGKTGADKKDEFRIHCSVPENWRDVSVWAWQAGSGRDAYSVWPGLKLESEGNGWFTGLLPGWIDSVIVCGEHGSVQSQRTTFRSQEVWISVCGDLRCDVNYSIPDLISVYAKVPVFWRTPHLWAWSDDGRNAFYSWPGGLMIDNGGAYRLSAPAWTDRIIINGKDGEVQTADIPVQQGKNVYISVNRQGDYSLSYDSIPEAPEEQEPVWEIPEHADKNNKPSADKKSAAGTDRQRLKKLFAAAAAVFAAGAFTALAIRHKIKKHR